MLVCAVCVCQTELFPQIPVHDQTLLEYLCKFIKVTVSNLRKCPFLLWTQSRNRIGELEFSSIDNIFVLQ
jgi:hypothetical protein